MTRRAVGLYSACQGSWEDLHNWLCVAHDPKWEQLELLCNRCLRKAHATAAGYRSWQLDMERLWQLQQDRDKGRA